MNSQLLSFFHQQYPNAPGPIYLAEAPGRLNILGEHTDYNGLPVLPFAIPSRIRMVFSPIAEPRIAVTAMSLAQSPEIEFALAPRIPPFEDGHWGNYVKAAAQDGVALGPILEEEEMQAGRERPRADSKAGGGSGGAAGLRGFCGVISSDLPMNAGLSSSSALVVASMLAFFAAQDWEIKPLPLARRAARAEHYVGTRGGGMDQAASLGGREGFALKMDFYPLRIEWVPVAVRCLFLTASSGVEARKSAGVKHQYNQRVLECRLIAELINRLLLCDSQSGIERIHYVGDLISRKSGPSAIGGGGEMEIQSEIERKILEIRRWKEQVLSVLPPLGEIDSRASRGEGAECPLETIQALLGREKTAGWIEHIYGAGAGAVPSALPLRRRARYLFEEWERVERAAIFLREGNLRGLGALLYEAQEGMARLYEISHPRVDALIDLAREFGLPGARMTGAGFGGSTLHLTPPEAEDEYIRFLAKRFYGASTSAAGVAALRGGAIHVFHPSAGASVRRIE